MKRDILCLMLVKNLLIALILSAPALTAQAREAFTINDGWKFSFAGDTAATRVHLPHSWNADAYSTRSYRRGEGVYEKELRIPSRFEGKRILLRLDGAASKSKIAIDGTQIADHVGAYSSHTIDITPHVTPGSTHRLTVTVDNSDRSIPPYSADFTFMGGLYRDAWLIATDPVHLDIINGAKDGVKVTPILLPGKDASGEERNEGKLEVEGLAVNRSASSRNVTVALTLYSPEGKEVARKSLRLTIPRSAAKPFIVPIDNLHDVELWTPESPRLYTLVTEISDKGKVLDRSEISTAFSTLVFGSDGGFLLNGKPYNLR